MYHKLGQMTICLPEAKALVSLHICTVSCLCVLSSFGELYFSSFVIITLRKRAGFSTFLGCHVTVIAICLFAAMPQIGLWHFILILASFLVFF